MEKVSVIVIGAGVAGLTASANLGKAGFNVTLLEAMDRIGGRTHSLKVGDGRYIEMGGEWIHGVEGNQLFELLNPHRVLHSTENLPQEIIGQFVLENGELVTEELAKHIKQLYGHQWGDPENWGKVLKEKEDLSEEEFASFILDNYRQKVDPISEDPKIIGAIKDWLHRATNGCVASDNWAEVSHSTKGEQGVSLEGGDVPWKPPYSYRNLHQLLLTGKITEDGVIDLPPWIHLNSPVTKIDYSSQAKIKVETYLGSVFTADHVIFTGSLGILKEKGSSLFNPPLSGKRVTAIDSIGMGTLSKLYYEFEDPWWPNSFQGLHFLWNDEEGEMLNYWRSDITLEELLEEVGNEKLPLWVRGIVLVVGVDSGAADNMIRLWVGGTVSRFLDQMDPDYIQTQSMKVLRKFCGKLYPKVLTAQPIRRFQSKWASNPYTKGVYTYRTLKSAVNDVWARDLAEPILDAETGKLICFAGEATHPTFYGTVHGAYETGLREFERIKKVYN